MLRVQLDKYSLRYALVFCFYHVQAFVYNMYPHHRLRQWDSMKRSRGKKVFGQLTTGTVTRNFVQSLSTPRLSHPGDFPNGVTVGVVANYQTTR